MRPGSLIRPTAIHGCGALLAASLMMGTARADFSADTVDTFNQETGYPALAIDPFDGTPHLAYRHGTTLRHAWRNATFNWEYTTIADVVGLADLARTPLGLAALYYGSDGSLVCARLTFGSGVWNPDTIPVPPGWDIYFSRPSLAIDWQTDQPVVAFTAVETLEPSVSYRHHLMLARREPSGWTVTEIYTTFLGLGPPSLVLDQAGRPMIGVWHGRGFGGNGPGAYFGEASGTGGPFSWSLVDGEANYFVSVARDRNTGVVRMAYTAVPSKAFGPHLLRYSYRDGNTWHMTEVYSNGDENRPTVMSLSLDAAGNPRIAQRREFNISAGESQDAPPSVNTCPGYVSTPRVMHFERLEGDGTGPFSAEIVSSAFANASGPRAKSLFGNASAIAWRDPAVGNGKDCTVHIIYGTKAGGTTGVPILDAPETGLSITPNPLPLGTSLAVAFRAPRPGAITLELFDVAGRRVASTSTAVDAGPRSLVWTPAGLRAGAYRLVVRRGSEVIGRRSLIVLR